jgi:hypothetical protein
MTLYSAVLFLHILCVLGLSVAMSFEWMSLSRMRAARSMAEIRAWVNPVPTLPAIAITSLLLLLFSGMFLTVQLQAGALAWPRVSFIALLVIAPFGAVTGRRMLGVRATVDTATDDDLETLRKRINASFLALSLGIRTGAIVGIILIMTSKPGLVACLGILLLALVLGLISTRALKGRINRVRLSQQS